MAKLKTVKMRTALMRKRRKHRKARKMSRKLLKRQQRPVPLPPLLARPRLAMYLRKPRPMLLQRRSEDLSAWRDNDPPVLTAVALAIFY